jgi:hypothetical protein
MYSVAIITTEIFPHHIYEIIALFPPNMPIGIYSDIITQDDPHSINLNRNILLYMICERNFLEHALFIVNVAYDSKKYLMKYVSVI